MSSVPTLMGSTSTSTGCPRTCAGFPNTAAVSGWGDADPASWIAAWGEGVHITCSWCPSSPRSPDEGSVQALLPGGGEHGLLPAAGPRHRRHALRPRHQRHLRAGPLPGNHCPSSSPKQHGSLVGQVSASAPCSRQLVACPLHSEDASSICRLCQPQMV